MQNRRARAESQELGMPNDEWCTPQYICDWLGPVDLDPCSNCNATVQATTRYYANGLDMPWTGLSVWINPPYSRPREWVMRGIQHAESGGSVWMLLRFDPTTRLFATIRECRIATIYLVDHRVRFVGAVAGPPTFASALVYSGISRHRQTREPWMWRIHGPD